MASTLVNINNGPTCKVKVLNPFSSDITLRQNAEIGKAEQTKRITNIVTEEENRSENNKRAMMAQGIYLNKLSRH
jgi:hypothetical protein